MRLRTISFWATALVVACFLGLTPMALAHETREVQGCGGEEAGRITLISPEETTYLSGDILLKMRVKCRGGMNFFVGVDGIGYAEEDSRLVPRPHSNPYCKPKDSDCWPSLTQAASDSWTEGLVRYTFRVPPGRHTLKLRQSLGTRPPWFSAIEIEFTVAGSELPDTGATGMVPAIALALALAVLLLGTILLLGSARRQKGPT